jgi:hypothetical protein
VQTATPSVDSSELGRTLVHEHVSCSRRVRDRSPNRPATKCCELPVGALLISPARGRAASAYEGEQTGHAQLPGLGPRVLAFTWGDGTTVPVPTMHYDEYPSSLGREDVQAVELPYDGGALSMVVIAPPIWKRSSRS